MEVVGNHKGDGRDGGGGRGGGGGGRGLLRSCRLAVRERAAGS